MSTDQIANALILLAFGILAGLPAAGLVLLLGRQTERPTPREQELDRQLRAAGETNHGLQMELSRLRRELADAQNTNRYVLRRMYAAEGILRTQAEQAAAELEIAR